MKRAGKISEPTDDELRSALASLSIWQTPSQFIGRVKKIGQRIPTERLWGNRYKALREATTLAELCQGGAVEAVRMGEDPPDGWIRGKGGQDEPVEITEVQEPNRRRGDEYKRGGAAASAFVPTSKVVERADEVVSQLEKAIAAKTGKYNFKSHLLVYLNFPHRGAEQQVQAGIAALRARYADCFLGIHVVTDTKRL